MFFRAVSRGVSSTAFLGRLLWGARKAGFSEMNGSDLYTAPYEISTTTYKKNQRIKAN